MKQKDWLVPLEHIEQNVPYDSGRKLGRRRAATLIDVRPSRSGGRDGSVGTDGDVFVNIWLRKGGFGLRLAIRGQMDGSGSTVFCRARTLVDPLALPGKRPEGN